MSEPLLVRAARGESVERLPVWFMRQAGRFLPEYREVRSKHSFLEMCATPELALEVSLQPLRRFELDGSIIFSDIMTPLLACGVEMDFAPGPVIAKPIRTMADVQALEIPDEGHIGVPTVQAIRMLRQAVDPKVAVIGFAGAPLTLAAYLVEGRGGKDFSALRAFLYAEPEAAHLLFNKLAVLTGRYLRAQVAAGAQMVQLFDSWAGILSADTYRTFALPAVKKVWSMLESTHVSKVFFAQASAHLLPLVTSTEACVFGFDWRLSIDEVRAQVGPNMVLQGNLDPAMLRAPEPVLRAATRAMLKQTRGGPHIVNVGHGLQPETPIDSLHVVIDEVRSHVFF